MSIGRAVSKQIARSSRVNFSPALLYDIHGHHHPHLRNNTFRFMMRPPDDNAAARFHHALAKDVSSIFKAYERDEYAETVRGEAFEKLRKLVQGMGNAGEYDLVDVSSGSLSDYPRLYHAPLECAIIDKARPDGLPPSYGDAPLPAAYDPLSLAAHLSGSGYSGTFIDTKPDLPGFTDSAVSSRPTRFAEPAWAEHNDPFSSLFNVLPPVLRVRAEIFDHPEILLSPAHPSNEFRWQLVKHAYGSSQPLRLLSSFFWLWLRSHGVEHYTWTTCVFLVMFYLQDRYKTPELLSEEAASQDQSPPVPQQVFWNRVERASPQYERLSVPSLPQMANPDTHTGKLIDDFFSFWAGNKYLPYSRVLDPLTGSHIPRKQKYHANAKNLDEVQVMKELSSNSAIGAKKAFWAYQPLVLVDPFLPSHNLAHTVTKHALQHMFHQARIAARSLKFGLPLTEVLGSELPPPHLSALAGVDTRGLLTGSQDSSDSDGQLVVLPSVSGPVPTMQRMYHTSARAEGKGKAKQKIYVLPAIHAPVETPESVLATRRRTIQKVQRIIREKYGKQYLVECFGSTQYGVDAATSDLDLVVLDQDRQTGFTPDITLESFPVIYNVRHLASTLTHHGFRVTRVIDHATVPIVKFDDPRTRLSCDININDRLGLFNTHLIARYCSLSPLLRPLLMLLKKWAKSLGLNDPSGAGGTSTFSSYALTLMTIGFLQSHELLPNLQADLLALEAEEAFWIRGRNDERTECDPRFNFSPNWSPSTNILIQDLRGALMAWFRFWAHQFNYSHEVMSIRDGGVVPRSEPSRATKTGDKQRLNRIKTRAKRERLEKKAAVKAARKAYAEMRYKLKRGLPIDGLEEIIKKGGLSIEIESVNNNDDDTKSAAAESEPEALFEDENENEADEDAEAIVDDADQDVDQEEIEEMDQTDIRLGRQPRSWALTALVVADPFIVAKNATGQITAMAIAHFTAECKRSLILLSSGAAFEDLLGDGSAAWRHGRQKKRRRGHIWRDMNIFVSKERDRQRREREKYTGKGRGKEWRDENDRVGEWSKGGSAAGEGPRREEREQRRAQSHPGPDNRSRPSSAVRYPREAREVQSDKDGAGNERGRGRGVEYTNRNKTARGRGRGSGGGDGEGGQQWMGRGRVKGRWEQRGDALRGKQPARARSQSR